MKASGKRRGSVTISSTARRVSEACLILSGAVLLTQAGLEWHRYTHFQSTASRDLAALAVSRRGNPVRADESKAPVVLGRMEIPQVKLSTVIVEGDDEKNLAYGAGHMPGTAKVGSAGNAVISGHRDTVFWPLRNVKLGELVTISTDREYRYRVDAIQIVKPEDVYVLADSQEPRLTLVSCYPFRHIGPAPERFIVSARLLSRGRR